MAFPENDWFEQPPDVFGGPANPPAPGNVEPPEPEKPAVVGTSGFDYGSKWDNLGPGRKWNMGDRPPSKEDWDAFSDEERAAFGIDNIEHAREAWQERFRPGGDLYKGDSGGGGGRAAAAPARGGAGSSFSFSGGLGSLLEQQITAAMGSKTFDKDTVERLKAAARQRAEGQRQTTSERVNSDLIRRGLGRSPLGAKLQQQADRSIDEQYASEASQIEVGAAIQNFKDKWESLDRAQKLLDSQMNYALGMEGNDIARANIALGYRRIEAEQQNLVKQLQNQIDMLGMSQQFQSDMWDKQLPLDVYRLLLGATG